jgi:putative ABC transport system permease protein
VESIDRELTSRCTRFYIKMNVRSNASFYEAIVVALGSLRSSKLRSFLTLLGIILATATLIAVMSMIHGMDVYIANSLANMGTEGFRVEQMVMIGQWDPKKFLEMRRRNPPLSREEYQFLKEKANLVKDIGMQTRRRVSVRFSKETLQDVVLMGVTGNMGYIANQRAELGRFITEVEDQHRVPVAFIGADLKDRFFPHIDPLGKTIDVDGRPYQIVGVAKAQGSVFGQSRDNFVMVPIHSYFRTYGFRAGIGYHALALDRMHLEQAQDEVRALLRAYRQLRPGQDDTFGMFASDNLVQAWDQMTGAIAATAVAVVSVFLVVGGVVIMNIMLAVVTERTREIGIRKSVGARRGDILSQFLVESSLLAAMGGVIGVLIAWAIAIIVRNTTPVPMAVPIPAVVISVTVSAVVGLFFGIYPARRAAMLDPIEALRAE